MLEDLTDKFCFTVTMLDIFHVAKYFGNVLLHVTLGTGSFIMSQDLRSGLNNEKPR